MALTKVSTDGVKDDAITKTKIPANQIEASELADNAVDTNAIADQAVSLSKLPHGDGSSDGKFLRANNGADPSFETITGTTINNNADNRVITGSGTANTLNGESSVVIDANGKLGVGLQSPNQELHVKGSGTVAAFEGTGGSCFIGIVDSDDSSQAFIGVDGGKLKFQTSGSSYSDKLVIDSSGKVGIGENSPLAQLHIKPASNVKQLLLEQNNATDGYALFQDGPNGGHLKFMRHINGSDTQTLLLRSGGGLCFGTDSAAANALDDYEEGTFTPTFTFSGVFNGTISLANGTYTKIGRLVNVNLMIGLASKGSHGGNATVSLPFTVANVLAGTSVESSGFIGYFNNYNGNVSALGATAQESTSGAILRGNYQGGNAFTVTNNNFNNNTEFRLSLTYFTNT